MNNLIDIFLLLGEESLATYEINSISYARILKISTSSSSSSSTGLAYYEGDASVIERTDSYTNHSQLESAACINNLEERKKRLLLNLE